MQEVDKWKNALALEESVQAIDMRDGKKYWVTKLKDGHIWMTQNLDLDLSDEIILTSKDTDLNDESLSGAYSSGYSYDSVEDIISWTSAHNTVKFFGTNVSEWVDSNTAPYSASKTDDTNTGHASLGNYYNWTAAIASNDSSSIVNNTFNNISNNPKNSICPKGWRLPTISNQGTSAGSTNEFARLNYLYNNASTTDYANLLLPPIYFTKAGQVRSYTLIDYPDAGSYWSSTVYSNELALNLYMSNNANIFNINANQQGHWYGNRNRTKSIRCIAR